MKLGLLFVAALALVLGGCCSPCAMNGRSACDNCPTSTCAFLCPPPLPGNRCAGWDFYIPCDLIEGRWTFDTTCSPASVTRTVSAPDWPSEPGGTPGQTGTTRSAG